MDNGFALKREVLEKQLVQSVEDEDTFKYWLSNLASRSDFEPISLFPRIIAALKNGRSGIWVLRALLTLPLKCSSLCTKIKEVPKQDIIQLCDKVIG